MPVSAQSIEAREDLVTRLRVLMFFRVIFITFLLGSTILINIKETSTYFEPYLIFLYSIIVSTYLLTLIYIFLISRIINLSPFAYLQIFLDTVFITTIVYVTGAIESVFSFLYIISIINASILLYRKGGFIIASGSSILYGACIGLEYYGVIPPITENISNSIYYNSSDILYAIAMNITGFYATAFLSSLLAEQARKSKEQLKEKEIDYKHLEALHDNIVQSINAGILTLNQEGEITSFNRAAEEISGYQMVEVLGKTFDQAFLLSDSRNQTGKEKVDIVQPPPRFELSFFRSDNVKLFLGFSTSVLRDKNGHEMGKIFIFRDLTLYRDMEEQIKRMDRLAAVGQLAAGIAHEIRNPLTSLSGSIQVLREELHPSEDSCKLMDIALRETQRLNSLITDFLLFAHPEQGEKQKIHLTTLIEDTLNLFANNAEYKNSIHIKKSIASYLFMEGNQQQISQVLWNVLKNAAQSQPNGGFISVEAGVETVFDNPLPNNASPRIKISVRDGGCGISHENQERIFDPFFTTKEFGSGLGLAITFRIIERHHGKIIVNSQENQGTEIVIYLPLLHPFP
jgi:two-component system sensor histidine kinase PilS (NtrC family)